MVDTDLRAAARLRTELQSDRQGRGRDVALTATDMVRVMLSSSSHQLAARRSVFSAGVLGLAARASGRARRSHAKSRRYRRIACPSRLHTIVRGSVLTVGDFEYHLDHDDARPGRHGGSRRRLGHATDDQRHGEDSPHSSGSSRRRSSRANTPVAIGIRRRRCLARLTVRGIATRSGSLGDRITVRTELGKRVEGTVVAPGRVRID